MISKKAGLSPQVLAKLVNALRQSSGARMAIGGGIGGGLGGLGGYYVTPHISGYNDVPAARRVSAWSDATLGAVTGALLAGKGQARGLVDAVKKMDPIKRFAWSGGAVLPVAATEYFPINVANQTKQREAAELSGDAARQFGEASRSMSIPNAISDVVRSGGFRGAVAGAGLAGIGGMLSGMYRPKTRGELENDEGRPEMMRRDALRYLLPAIIAGGVIGSMRGRAPDAPPAAG